MLGLNDYFGPIESMVIGSLVEHEHPIIHSDCGAYYRWSEWIRRAQQAKLNQSNGPDLLCAITREVAHIATAFDSCAPCLLPRPTPGEGSNAVRLRFTPLAPWRMTAPREIHDAVDLDGRRFVLAEYLPQRPAVAQYPKPGTSARTFSVTSQAYYPIDAHSPSA